MSKGFFHARPINLLVLILFVGAMVACSDPGPAQRTILDRQGTVRGLSQDALTLQVKRGRKLVVQLEQSGLDLYLQLSLNGRSLGRFDSHTGRYGEELVSVVLGEGGSLQVEVGALRLPQVQGTYRLRVREVSDIGPAERDFTSASRVDDPLSPSERIRLFADSAKAFAGTGNVREEGLASLAAVNLLTDTGTDDQVAVSLGERAVAALRKGTDPLLLASALNALAVVLGETESRDQMNARFDEARGLYAKWNSRVGVAESQLYAAALAYRVQASADLLATFRAVERECDRLHETVCQAMALTNSGVLLRDSGDNPAAFDSLYRALNLLDPVADPNLYALANDNLAFSMRMVGDFDMAIFHHERALSAFSAFGECSGVARSLYGAGYSMLGIGDSEQALRFYKVALEHTCDAAVLQGSSASKETLRLTARDLCSLASRAIDRQKGDRAIAAWASWDLGNFARSQRDPVSALVCHEIGTRLATTPNYRMGTTLESVRDLLEMNRLSEAQTLFSSVEPDVVKSHPWYRAQAAEVGAQMLAVAGQSERAMKMYAEASRQYRNVGNLEGSFSALSRRASLGLNAANPASDEMFADADAALEDVRLLSLDPAFSASLFASGRRIYEEWIENMLARDKDAKSATLATLAISERSRNRLLAQITKALQVGQEARNARQRSVAEETLALLERAEAGRPIIAANSAADPGNFARLHQALGLGASRFDASSARDSSTRLEAFQRGLDGNTTVVEYLVGEKRSHAWVMRADSLIRFDLGAAAPIRAAVASARAALEHEDGGAQARSSLQQLYELVWRPIRPAIRGERVEIVPDDVLHEAPFAALWDSERNQFLVQDISVTYLPSIQYAQSREAAAAPPRPARGALLVGDPVYDLGDARHRCSPDVKEGTALGPAISLRRIPASRREVEGIEATLRANGTRAEMLTGCTATRDRVLASSPENFRFIHFATHATADRVLPQRSAVFLSEWNDEGQQVSSMLSAADLLAYPIRSELAVLSGCSTAGGRQFGGEGSLGLAFSLIAGGSRQVISTLWPVGDAASATAMNALYDGLITRGERASEALRNAQLEMLRSERWKEPRHWAAYSLLGT